MIIAFIMIVSAVVFGYTHSMGRLVNEDNIDMLSDVATGRPALVAKTHSKIKSNSVSKVSNSKPKQSKSSNRFIADEYDSLQAGDDFK